MTFTTANKLAVHFHRIMGIRPVHERGYAEDWRELTSDSLDERRELARRIRILRNATSPGTSLSLDERSRDLFAYGEQLALELEGTHG